jgi:NifU-like protein involved in Fe-S cluster formation
LSLRIHDDRIEAARFLAYGCPPTLACGSVLAEMLEGMSIGGDEVDAESTRRGARRLVAAETARAALAVETLRSAIEIANRA